ncbi:ribonuclease P [Chytridium lagenaria]|nr:ribonuclease P [Chytridium lagenaria]
MDRLREFKKKNLLLVLTQNPYGSDLLIAVLPTGKVMIEVAKDLYEQLGMNGQRMKKVEDVFRIEIDFTEDDFQKPAGPIKRFIWAIKNVLIGEIEGLLVPYEARDLDGTIDEKAVEARVNTANVEGIMVPDLADVLKNSSSTEAFLEMLEWIGMVAVKGYSVLSATKPIELDMPLLDGCAGVSSSLSTTDIIGYFSESTVSHIMKHAREHFEKTTSSWLALLVWESNHYPSLNHRRIKSLVYILTRDLSFAAIEE